jgi:hypothetical protein
VANVYVWSGAAGGGTGADWANAYTTLAAAATAKLAGDIFFVAHDHAETSGTAVTTTFAGTDANPNKVYCVDRGGSVPPVSADLRTTAQIITTGAIGQTFAGTLAECYGIQLHAGTSTGAATINLGNTSSRSQRFTKCQFRLNASATTSRINFNNAANANAIHLRDCTVSFSHVSQFMNTAGRVYWRNTQTPLVTGAIIPTVLMSFSNTGFWFFEGCDLSASGSGKSLVNGVTTNSNQSAVYKDCKLGASVNIVSANANAYGGVEATLIRCDSGDTNYRTEKYAFSGTQTTETTIVRTGGASDGTTPISWKIVTTINCRWEFPFECLPISIWNETVGSPVTVTVEGICSSGSVPNTDDLWLDVEYFGTSGFPLGTETTSNKADGLATGTPLPVGSGTWGGAFTTQFKISQTITPAEKGPITIYVRCGKPFTTFYVDPKPVIS